MLFVKESEKRGENVPKDSSLLLSEGARQKPSKDPKNQVSHLLRSSIDTKNSQISSDKVDDGVHKKKNLLAAVLDRSTQETEAKFVQEFEEKDPTSYCFEGKSMNLYFNGISKKKTYLDLAGHTPFLERQKNKINGYFDNLDSYIHKQKGLRIDGNFKKKVKETIFRLWKVLSENSLSSESPSIALPKKLQTKYIFLSVLHLSLQNEAFCKENSFYLEVGIFELMKVFKHIGICQGTLARYLEVVRVYGQREGILGANESTSQEKKRPQLQIQTQKPQETEEYSSSNQLSLLAKPPALIEPSNEPTFSQSPSDRRVQHLSRCFSLILPSVCNSPSILETVEGYSKESQTLTQPEWFRKKVSGMVDKFYCLFKELLNHHLMSRPVIHNSLAILYICLLPTAPSLRLSTLLEVSTKADLHLASTDYLSVFSCFYSWRERMKGFFKSLEAKVEDFAKEPTQTEQVLAKVGKNPKELRKLQKEASGLLVYVRQIRAGGGAWIDKNNTVEDRQSEYKSFVQIGLEFDLSGINPQKSESQTPTNDATRGGSLFTEEVNRSQFENLGKRDIEALEASDGDSSFYVSLNHISRFGIEGKGTVVKVESEDSKEKKPSSSRILYNKSIFTSIVKLLLKKASLKVLGLDCKIKLIQLADK